MVIDFDRTIAYRCAACGEITYGDFSLFELSGKKGISVHCACGESNISITSDGRTSFNVELDCVICDSPHKYSLKFDTLAKRDCNDFQCPEVGVGLAFIGKNKSVNMAMEESEAMVGDVLMACGLEHTGKNGILMLKALDKIQDLSENDNLKCHCGSRVIDIEVRENEIVLKCCVCGTKSVIDISEIKKNGFSRLSKIIIGQK